MMITVSIYRFSIICILTLTLIKKSICDDYSIEDIIPKGYDPKKLPLPKGLTVVNVSVIINDLLAVTEADQSFQIDFTMNMRWFDKRLNTDFIDFDNLILDQSFVSKFWTPDLLLQNALSSSIVNSFHSVQYIGIGRDGNISYAVRMSGKFICKMDLSNYPQDYQYCSIEIVSLTKSIQRLQLLWDKFVAIDTGYPKFVIKSSNAGNCVKLTILGESPCIVGTIKLVRRVSYYVMRVYAPSFLSVIAAFVGFWIPIQGWPARVAIVVTPLLALITQDIGLNNEINVYYVVAIHWWMMFCHCFIFMALIEYAVAISWAHFVNDKKANRVALQTQGNFDISKELRGHYFGNRSWFNRYGRHIDKILYFCFGDIDYAKDPLSRNKVDYFSRILFPLLFLTFILIFIFSSVCPWAAKYNM